MWECTDLGEITIYTDLFVVDGRCLIWKSNHLFLNSESTWQVSKQITDLF